MESDRPIVTHHALILLKHPSLTKVGFTVLANDVNQGRGSMSRSPTLPTLILMLPLLAFVRPLAFTIMNRAVVTLVPNRIILFLLPSETIVLVTTNPIQRIAVLMRVGVIPTGVSVNFKSMAKYEKHGIQS